MGADALLSGGIFADVVVAGGVIGGDSSSDCSISPVQPTSVWSQGVSFDERKENESNRADVPRLCFNSQPDPFRCCRA